MSTHEHGTPRRLPPNRLWKFRKHVGLTQRQAAEILGYHSASDLSNYEHGRKLPSLVTALKLEIVYRAPVAFLFTDMYVPMRIRLREREGKLRAEWEARERRQNRR